jgi:GAF domain-containing protein
LPGQDFTPFAVVAVVLLWQWLISLSLPKLEKLLIYPEEDDGQLNRLQNLSDQLLTRNDLVQLLEATLAGICDYLRVNTAFAVSLLEVEPELIATIGRTLPAADLLDKEQDQLLQMLTPNGLELRILTWHSYWIVALRSPRGSESESRLIGFIGLLARAPQPDFTEDELQVFQHLVRRAAQALDDLALQAEITAALEGLLPQIQLTRSRAAEVEYRRGRQQRSVDTLMPDRSQFVEQVRAALRHYWGGPGLTHSGLLELSIVRAALDDNENNPVRALRSILVQAIESQRPEGERKLLSPEWTIYNILDLRFIEKQKVREVAEQMALSEPDLYRKQRIAIEAVADTLIDMENGAITP